MHHLTQKELYHLGEAAEFGDLDHSTISKRHVRILFSLYFVLSMNPEMISLPYTELTVSQQLIERFFDKRYPIGELAYWSQDLAKRDYIALLDTDLVHDGVQRFVITERGIALLEETISVRESLFESNTRNSLRFLN